MGCASSSDLRPEQPASPNVATQAVTEWLGSVATPAGVDQHNDSSVSVSFPDPDIDATRERDPLADSLFRDLASVSVAGPVLDGQLAFSGGHGVRTRDASPLPPSASSNPFRFGQQHRPRRLSSSSSPYASSDDLTCARL